MELKEFIAISGKPGLFKIINQTKNGFIVESLIDKKRFPTHAQTAVLSLEDISIYGESEDVPLMEVLKKIYEKENGEKTISHKEPKEKLCSYMESILPEYDKDRVYPSDMKKLFQWYNLLHDANALNFNAPLENATEEKLER